MASIKGLLHCGILTRLLTGLGLGRVKTKSEWSPPAFRAYVCAADMALPMLPPPCANAAKSIALPLLCGRDWQQPPEGWAVPLIARHTLDFVVCSYHQVYRNPWAENGAQRRSRYRLGRNEADLGNVEYILKG